MLNTILISLVLLCGFALAEIKQGACDSKISTSARLVEEARPYHEAEVAGRMVQVGGDGARYAKNIDFLALQRGLIACSPGLIQCLAEQKFTGTANVLATFELNPSKDVASVSKLSIRWTTVQMSAAEPCVKNLISSLKFGLIVKEPVTVSVPVKIIKK